MEKLVEITSFSNVNDAYILRTLLESENINCFLQDENSASIMNGYANIGGVKVMVSSEDYDRAAWLMKEHGYDVEGLNDKNNTENSNNIITNPPPKKGIHGGMKAAVWLLLIIVIALLYYLWKWYSITE